MKKYLLREYGSWGVMTLSFLTGVAVSPVIGPYVLPCFASLILAINSKQALTLWMRSGGSGALRIFAGQAALSALLLILVLGRDMPRFLPLALLPFSYILLNRFLGEHSIVTEVAGFLLLTMSSLLARYSASGVFDPRLYAASAVFFIAGVFKVRLQFRKGLRERTAMAIYLLSAICIYILLDLPLAMLLPLGDNLVFALFPYRAKLQTTGWVEVAKGAVFLALTASLYR